MIASALWAGVCSKCLLTWSGRGGLRHFLLMSVTHFHIHWTHWAEDIVWTFQWQLIPMMACNFGKTFRENCSYYPVFPELPGGGGKSLQGPSSQHDFWKQIKNHLFFLPTSLTIIGVRFSCFLLWTSHFFCYSQSLNIAYLKVSI